MKTTKTIMAVLFAFATLAFASCGKENNNPNPEPEPEPEPQPVQNYNLGGTTWECNIVNTYMYQGLIAMNIDMLWSLDFADSTSGETFVDFTMEVPDYPAGNQHQDITEAFTYTFNGDTLYLIYTDADTGEETRDFYLYDRTDNTFWQEIPDEVQQGINVRELYGTDKAVFRLVRGNFSL